MKVQYHLLPKSCTVVYQWDDGQGGCVQRTVSVSADDDRYQYMMRAIRDGRPERLPRIVERNIRVSQFLIDVFGEDWWAYEGPEEKKPE